jgi:hypothetical protein
MFNSFDLLSESSKKITGKLKTLLSCLTGITILAAITSGGCTKDPGPNGSFPVNEVFAAELVKKGVPADIARFFAGARMETRSPDDTTCIYLQTFPNGATREITLRINPRRKYTPTAAELANTPPGSNPVYDFNYSEIETSDGSTKIQMSYYVPGTSLKVGKGINQKSSLQTARSIQFMNIAPVNFASEGVGISWVEIGKKGADVSIGSLIDYAKESGVKVGPLGSIYALASALSDVTGALELSKQNGVWMKELFELEDCAANPTNPVAKSDPNYSPAAVAKIQSARNELEQVTAVRFLNIMTETFSGINPVTAVLSIGLSEGFVWSEQTLDNYSETTIMREARLMVVPCDNTGALDGNIDVLWECTTTTPTGTDHEVWHIVTNLRWIFDPSEMQYVSQGTFNFDYTYTATAGGITCTGKKSFAGSIANSGRLIVISDPVVQNLLGYGFIGGGFISVQVAATYSCPGTALLENRTIEWLPTITGFPGAGGSYEGEMTVPSCIGNASTGTLKVTWRFSVPSAK